MINDTTMQKLHASNTKDYLQTTTFYFHCDISFLLL